MEAIGGVDDTSRKTPPRKILIGPRISLSLPHLPLSLLFNTPPTKHSLSSAICCWHMLWGLTGVEILIFYPAFVVTDPNT
jgi:hypothetical protein